MLVYQTNPVWTELFSCVNTSVCTKDSFLFLQCMHKVLVFAFLPATCMECFHSRGQHTWKIIGQKEMFAWEDSSTPTGLVWYIKNCFLFLQCMHEVPIFAFLTAACIERFYFGGQHTYKIIGAKGNFLYKKRVQLPQEWFGTPTWPPFYCFGTTIWLSDVMWKRFIDCLHFIISTRFYVGKASRSGWT